MRKVDGSAEVPLPQEEPDSDGLPAAEKKAIKVAKLWSPRLAKTGYFEVVNGFLEHYGCCLKLSTSQAMLVLQLMKYRSLTLKPKPSRGSKTVPAEAVQAGSSWVGRERLAEAMDIEQRQVTKLATQLVEKGMLSRVIRPGTGVSGTNLWDIRPLLQELEQHILDHEDHYKNAKENKQKPRCPCLSGPKIRPRRGKKKPKEVGAK